MNRPIFAGVPLTSFAYGCPAKIIWFCSSERALSGLVPVPGGVGAQEAALTAGMVAVGVDESTAFAVALTQRLCTFYLPPIWGYFSLRWLSQKGYI